MQNRFVMQPLQNPTFCRSTVSTIDIRKTEQERNTELVQHSLKEEALIKTFATSMEHIWYGLTILLANPTGEKGHLFLPHCKYHLSSHLLAERGIRRLYIQYIALECSYIMRSVCMCV
jgi:hypothetical protein